VKQIRERLRANPVGDSMPSGRIPADVATRLGWYVYAYVDPRDGSIFYVGKGKGQRLMAHLSDAAESRKTCAIASLREAGLSPRLDVLAHGLADEETAFCIEAAVIDVVGLERLTNEVRGWRSVETGRMALDELVAYYGANPVEVRDPSLLIRINRLYRHGMTPLELYEATRGVWKIGLRREQARYAFAVFEQVVREVYVIERWHPALTTKYTTRAFGEVSGRWEFTGRVAPEDVRSRYVGRSVAKYFKKGMQSPVTYAG